MHVDEVPKDGAKGTVGSSFWFWVEKIVHLVERERELQRENQY